MKHIFVMDPETHNIFFAARMAGLFFVLCMVLIASIGITLYVLHYRDHKRYLKNREEKREQHVKELLARERDKLVHAPQSCIQTTPDMFAGVDARIIEEAFSEFR
jgi:hypothetical protein